MYKVLIADDEKNIREGLEAFIPWESINLRVVAILDNGRKVLDYLKNNEVDILLLDVRMPVLTGLDVMETVSVKYPGLKAIILSGYADFKFAQKAISYGVTEYLLKPIAIPQICEILHKMKVELDNQRGNEKILMDLKLIKYLKSGSQVDFPHKLQSLYPEKYVWVALLDNRHGKWDLKQGKVYVKDGIRFSVLIEDENRAVVFLLSHSLQQEDKLMEIATRWKGNYFSNAFMAVSTVCHTILEASQGFHSASQIIQKAFFLGPERPLHLGDLHKRFDQKNLENPMIEEDWERLNRSIRNHDDLLLLQFFDDLQSRISALPTVSSEMIYQTYDKIIHKLERVLGEMGYSIHSVVDYTFDIHLDSIRKIDYYLDLHYYVQALCQTCIEGLSHKSTSRRRRVVEMSIEWIETHYEGILGLDIIADKFQISKEYFCTIFKEETGTNFNQYLKVFRMERAIGLMKENPVLKIYEVAQKVGYPDSKYFCRVFKTHFGQYPDEYRKRIAGVSKIDLTG